MGWPSEGLDKEEYDRIYSDKELFRRLISYFRPYLLIIILISIAITTDAFFQAYIPVLIANILDVLEVDPSVDSVTDSLILIGFFFVVSFVMIAIREILTARAVHGAIRDLRRNTFNSLVKKDLSFFDTQPSGKLASRVTNDTFEFGTTVALTANLFSQIFSVIFILYFLWIRSIRLTLLVGLYLPIVTFVALSFRKIARYVSLRSQRVIAKVNALIQETTSGIYVAKSFRAEENIYKEFDQLNKQNFRASLFRQIVFSSLFPMLSFVSAFGITIVVYFGALDVLQAQTPITNFLVFLPADELSIADWFLFYQAVQFFYIPVIQIASYWSQFQLGLAASERIFSIIDVDNKIVQYDNQQISEMKGKIEFQNLSFGYTDDKLVFNNFNLTIEPGEKLAIVGHTGAGKSTIGKLLARYYEFQDGKIQIDGKNIRSLNIDSYRNRLAIISQEVFLWNDTIRENLLYGIDRINGIDKKLTEVLEKIEVMDWIEKFEGGLDSNIGERGGNLSMGQRQLIAFARILLRDPAILIMDEATASVDPLTEVKIQKATKILLENRTSIIIAHRLSTIKNANRIIVLKEGKIIEEGSHDNLIQQRGHYADLYDTYFRHQSLSYIEQFAKSDEG